MTEIEKRWKAAGLVGRRMPWAVELLHRGEVVHSYQNSKQGFQLMLVWLENWERTHA